MSKIIVTSALPYANGPLHIGQIAGCYLPADIYVRYQKLKNRDVIHICGTDDHGTPITIRAIEENTTPKDIADKYHANIKESLENFGINYENFSRTEKEGHYKNAQKFFITLYNKGFLTPNIEEQMFCENCKRFLPDRFIEGICPYCGNEDVRGDECEKCGRWIEPTLLKEPKCKICKNTPKLKKSKHWYLRLDLLQPKIEEWVKTIKWKDNVLNFVENWLKEGLKPRPVTRDMEWGIPVPLEEAKGKVIYVWFEALIGYISNTIEWNKEKWQDYWKNKDTKLIHFIGKDNIVFHAIVWPGMLIGHNEYVLPHFIPANEFLNIENKKISTSKNWAVWLPDYMKEFEPDPLRYTLTVNAPEKGDTNFSWDDFLIRNNNELADILGNFVNRTLKFITLHMNGKIPHPNKLKEEDEAMLKKIEKTKNKVGELIENFEFKSAIKEIMNLAHDGNKYFDYNKPWEKGERTPTIIYICSNIVGNMGILLEPFLPFTAQKIRQIMKIEKIEWDSKIQLDEGMVIGEPKILFKKLEKEKIEKEKEKLGLVDHIIVSETKQPHSYIKLEEFKKLDIRIGEVKEASRIKRSDKLIKLKVNLEKEERTIIAGIGENYNPEELIGKKIVILTNIEPKEIFGEKSEGMLLAADYKNKPILIIPDKDIPPGSIVR